MFPTDQQTFQSFINLNFNLTSFLFNTQNIRDTSKHPLQIAGADDSNHELATVSHTDKELDKFLIWEDLIVSYYHKLPITIGP